MDTRVRKCVHSSSVTTSEHAAFVLQFLFSFLVLDSRVSYHSASYCIELYISCHMCRVKLCQLFLCHFTLCYIIVYLVSSYYTESYPDVSCRSIPDHLVSYFVMLWRIMFNSIVSYLNLSYSIALYLITRYPTESLCAIWYRIVSCSCWIASCHIVSLLLLCRTVSLCVILYGIILGLDIFWSNNEIAMSHVVWNHTVLLSSALLYTISYCIIQIVSHYAVSYYLYRIVSYCNVPILSLHILLYLIVLYHMKGVRHNMDIVIKDCTFLCFLRCQMS